MNKTVTVNNSNNKNILAIFGLLFGATCWGFIWYPYRILSDAGISGVASSFYTYTIACVIAGLYFARYFLSHWRSVFAQPISIIWLSIVAGWTNLSYVLAVIDGEVMRIMLLFYLSPLWTLLLAHFWLKEPISRAGFMAIIVAMIGAYIMLANPFSGNFAWPLPQNKAEWLALSAGIGFALTNVITRKAVHLSIAAKSFAVWLGVVVMAVLFMPFLGKAFPKPSFFTVSNWLIMLGIAILIMSATLLVQYGVTKMTATRASVLFLFELIVAAVASYYLAHEAMKINEWLGGLLIIAAALYSVFSHANTD